MKLGTSRHSAARLGLILLAIAGIITLLPRATFSATRPHGSDAPAERAARGKVLFRIYCANCHGKTADGDGPVAEFLKTPPPDLKQLRSKNENEFPTDRIYRLIDGRDVLAVHGAREMPVWGLTFQDRGRDSNQEEEVAEKIKDLVAFLESIQKD